MKIPRRAPTTDEALAFLGEGIPRVRTILRAVPEATVTGKYLHWDELRHRTPPSGITLDEWWFALKYRRAALATAIPLTDTQGRRFAFTLADPLPERLHEIDLLTGGTIQTPEPVTNPATRDRYLVRSLIEEATTSSQLEGAATTREIAKEMIRQGRPPRDRSERMILNNYQTMERIIQIKDEALTRALLLEIHRMVTDGTMTDATAIGRFRRSEEPCVVADDYGEVFHIPPPAEQLDARCEQMIDFANELSARPFVHPAIRSMVLHFWLAYDHPFLDGNGRTARALFYWSMLHHHYWLFEYLSISRIILKAPVRYGMAYLHTETDENDLTYFLIYHADVIAKAIQELHRYLDMRSNRLRALDEQLQGMASLNDRQRDLISHALRHPGHRYTVEAHRRSQDVVYETARTDLLDLAARGLLNHQKVGKRWTFTPVADLERKLRQPH